MKALLLSTPGLDLQVDNSQASGSIDCESREFSSACGITPNTSKCSSSAFRLSIGKQVVISKVSLAIAMEFLS